MCSVKLFQTSSSLSFAKLSKLSSKHGATQSKTEPNLVVFKANTVAVYSLQNKQNKETPGQHSLTPSSRRSTPTRPNFHSLWNSTPRHLNQNSLSRRVTGFFFFLHCRTSARHCRSTTGMSEEKKSNFPESKSQQEQTHQPNKATPTKSQTRQRSREICKLGETGETSASLSSPSQVLFCPTLSMFRCLPYQYLHQDTQASLEHLVDVAV